MATKKYAVAYHKSTSDDPAIVIQRISDGYFWSNGVGFIANGGSPVYNAMSETFHDYWEYETAFEVWANGIYNVLIQGAPDTPVAGYYETISGDTQVDFIQASSITAKNAVSAIKTSLEPILASLQAQATAIGVLSDRIDSMNQTLSRRDYNSTGP